jgi:hypothetical protein
MQSEKKVRLLRHPTSYHITRKAKTSKYGPPPLVKVRINEELGTAAPLFPMGLKKHTKSDSLAREE